MTVQTSLRRRHRRVRGFVDVGVAVTAIEAHTGDMVFVAKRNRLVLGYIHLIDVVDTVDIEEDAEEYADNDQRGDDHDFGQAIGTAVENLGHIILLKRRVPRKLVKKKDQLYD